jgi:uncharacterized protein YbbC (DUF1343 family)
VTGLDRLLERGADRMARRRWALLAHGASVTADLVPAHLALARSAAGRPALLIGPEHGFYGVEQDMIPAAAGADPWTGAPIASLYGDSASSLEPAPGLFDGVDLLVIDLQDVGSRYYTYAATAVWAAEAALGAGREVWVLDRPNPLGGERVEGGSVRPGFESFVGAFALPVRHGLTLGELVRLEAGRRGLPRGLTVWRMEGWEREHTWEDTGRPWIAPSPNMPTAATAHLYPGVCLIEATEASEGRGTTRPFHLVGTPGVDPLRLASRLSERWAAAMGPEPGVAAIPCYFRPQFQKHAGARCGGVELVVTDAGRLRPYRAGVELLLALAECAPGAFAWREAPYELVTDRPAIDLLTGGEAFRCALESGRGLDEWLATWRPDERAFLEERAPALLYPHAGETGEMGESAETGGSLGKVA